MIQGFEYRGSHGICEAVRLRFHGSSLSVLLEAPLDPVKRQATSAHHCAGSSVGVATLLFALYSGERWMMNPPSIVVLASAKGLDDARGKEVQDKAWYSSAYHSPTAGL